MVKKLIKIGVLVVLAGVSFFISMMAAQRFGATSSDGAGPEGADQASIPAEIQILDDLANADPTNLKPKEQQLNELIIELRVKIRAAERREIELSKREERIRTAESNLSAQIKELELVKMELISVLPTVKAAEEKLMQVVTWIGQQDRGNSEKIAKGWGKMEPASVARLVLEMWKDPTTQTSATKIIYFLTDKQWAAVMDEVRDMGPAVEIVQRLQTVVRETDAATEGA